MTAKQEKSIAYHKTGCNCCQSVALAFAEELGIDPVTLFRIGEGFGGGLGNKKHICGALSGAVMCMGLMNSAADLENPTATKAATVAFSARLADRFIADHGSTICEVLKGETGEPYISCDEYIAHATAYVEEILAEQGK